MARSKPGVLRRRATFSEEEGVLAVCGVRGQVGQVQLPRWGFELSPSSLSARLSLEAPGKEV